jgi:hypothetical protein
MASADGDGIAFVSNIDVAQGQEKKRLFGAAAKIFTDSVKRLLTLEYSELATMNSATPRYANTSYISLCAY